MPLIFVYGTLKRGFSNAAELTGAEYVREARTVNGYELHMVDGFPALSRADSGIVNGELYVVTDEHLKRLDAFEDVPNWYQRESIELEDGTNVQAYVLSREAVRGKPKIDSGKFPGP